jgi:hypothetical protein
MRITVVHAHPSNTSFSRAVLHTVLDALKHHEVDLCDLYTDDFHPALTETEHREYLGSNPIQDPLVRRYAEYVQRAEAIVFVYPTWWSGLPAMLKGWFDRVLVQGVAFGFDDNGRIQPQLAHLRRIAGVTTYGSSRLVTWIGVDGGRRTLHRTLRVASGWRTRTTWLGLHSMDRATDAQRKEFLEHVHREFASW